jgi:hypothetical protein
MIRAVVLFGALGIIAVVSGFPVEEFMPDMPSLNWVASRRASAEGDAGAPRCLIKGVIGAKGERLYHLPGSAYYERTPIDTARGERWFCSKAEALEAGWRPFMR